MKLTEQALTQVVADASERMAEPQYVTALVDSLRRSQPDITQYVIAHQDELELEGIVTTLCHAALLCRGLQLATGSAPGRVRFAQLDAAARACPDLESLAVAEPNAASYIASNVDLAGGEDANQVAARVLTHLTQALVDA